MTMFNKLKLGITLCALLSFSAASGADEIQDANKLFKQGQNAQALEKVNAFLASKPKDAQARFLKGLIVNEQGNPNDAIKIFTDLTDDYPELPEPYNNLAVLYAGQGQYDKAKIALEMAIRTHPSYATAHENLGDIYAKMASQAYDRALQLDKNNTATQTKLALIRDLFGKGRSSSKPATATAATTTKPTVVATAPTTTQPAAATATPAVTEKPATKPAVVATGDTKADLLKATHAWAAAWSAQNSSKYLGFYADDFKTPAGTDRATWEAQRKERIAKPKSIEVGIADAKVSVIDAQHASVSFKQSYRATHLKTSSHKVLIWVKTSNGWQIAEEQSSN